MQEMIAVTNVSPEEFATIYNRYNQSRMTEKAPSGRGIVGCESYQFYPEFSTDTMGFPIVKGAGFIIVNVKGAIDGDGSVFR